jgi:pimeloyl-ACP methyl ester carboxylesterase
VASFKTSDGVRLNYTESGDPSGRPVVLIAGFKAPATAWATNLAPLEKAGYRVIGFDRRGHGLSERSPLSPTMQRHGADLHELLEKLDLRDAALIGGSMGGNTIWSTVSQFGDDRIADIVIVDQTPKMLNSDDWAFGFYDYNETNRDSFFATGIPDPGRFKVTSKGFRRLRRLFKAMDTSKEAREFTDVELALLNDHAKADWRPAIASVGVPALFIAGRESEFWPAEHAAAAAALNPLASSAVIEKDGHAANIEQPDAFNALVVEFLAQH